MREADYGYEYPIKAQREEGWEINVRLMRKDEMPDDGETYYCDKDASIYRLGEPDFKLI